MNPNSQRISLRAYLVANLFDGSDEGMHSAPTGVFLDDLCAEVEAWLHEQSGPSDEAIKAARDWEAGVPVQDVDVNAMVAYILHPQRSATDSEANK